MCGGGPDNVTQTTRTEPSPLISGQLSQLANTAGSFNPTLEETGTNFRNFQSGIAALSRRGQEGAPVVDDATNLTRSTLQGNFLTPESNPFLEDTFNRAADLTRTRLSSEFAGSGRNLGASAPARSEELQTLASNIFGGNFARERALQANAVNQALPLAANDFQDIEAQISAGSRQLDSSIDRFAALAPAAGGTAVSSQPLVRNRTGGALGGALAGAQLGSIIPGIGTGIGALGGGLLGLFG